MRTAFTALLAAFMLAAPAAADIYSVTYQGEISATGIPGTQKFDTVTVTFQVDTSMGHFVSLPSSGTGVVGGANYQPVYPDILDGETPVTAVVTINGVSTAINGTQLGSVAFEQDGAQVDNLFEVEDDDTHFIHFNLSSKSGLVSKSIFSPYTGPVGTDPLVFGVFEWGNASSAVFTSGPIPVPGPILGTGLPGLVLLGGGLFNWWRRRARGISRSPE